SLEVGRDHFLQPLLTATRIHRLIAHRRFSHEVIQFRSAFAPPGRDSVKRTAAVRASNSFFQIPVGAGKFGFLPPHGRTPSLRLPLLCRLPVFSTRCIMWPKDLIDLFDFALEDVTLIGGYTKAKAIEKLLNDAASMAVWRCKAKPENLEPAYFFPF